MTPGGEWRVDLSVPNMTSPPNPPPLVLSEHFSADLDREIRRAVDLCRQRRIRFVVMWPPCESTYFNNNRAAIDRIDRLIRAIGVPVIARTTDTAYPFTDFMDSEFHPHPRIKPRHTSTLIDGIRGLPPFPPDRDPSR